jgi:hypothetical protein
LFAFERSPTGEIELGISSGREEGASLRRFRARREGGADAERRKGPGGWSDVGRAFSGGGDAAGRHSRSAGPGSNTAALDDQIKQKENELMETHAKAHEALGKPKPIAICTCGAELFEGAKFCGKCGARIERAG